MSQKSFKISGHLYRDISKCINLLVYEGVFIIIAKFEFHVIVRILS